MSAIEPNWASLFWFAVFATISMVALLVVLGMFPLRTRPESMRSGSATLLVLANAILVVALWLATALYGYAELRWTSLIVVTGLVVLFAPGLFEVWPQSFRDRRRGLVVLASAQLLALVALARLVRPLWVKMS